MFWMQKRSVRVDSPSTEDTMRVKLWWARRAWDWLFVPATTWFPDVKRRVVARGLRLL